MLCMGANYWRSINRYGGSIENLLVVVFDLGDSREIIALHRCKLYGVEYFLNKESFSLFPYENPYPWLWRNHT